MSFIVIRLDKSLKSLRVFALAQVIHIYCVRKNYLLKTRRIKMKNDNVESYQEMEKRLRRKSIVGVSIAFILPISM